MINIQKCKNESFLDYAERLIQNRKEYDLDKVEVYELLYGEQVSSDHARKCLTNLEKTIEACKKNKVEQQIHKDLNDKDLEKELSKQYKTTIELNKDGSQTSDKLLAMSEEECKDVNFILKAHGYDINSWELVSARNNIWNAYSKQDGIQILYSSKIVVKPLSEFMWNEENIRELFSNIKTENKSKANVKPSQYEENGNALVVPIADFHYGLFSDKYSTGNDYNLEIAEEIYYDTLSDILHRVQSRKFEKVLFVVGNDFINFDNIGGTTTKGTQQDNASLWFSVVKNATQLLINGIDMLSEIAPVDVVYVPSNHDLHTMFGIMQTLCAWYKDEKNISVDDSPLSRKYYKFGKNLIGLSHDIKVKDGLTLMTTEAKNMWSDSSHMIWLLAHLHQQMIYDKKGHLETFRLPTISGWSRWSNNMGYVQSEKKNKSFIIDSNLGIIDEMNTVIVD